MTQYACTYHKTSYIGIQLNLIEWAQIGVGVFCCSYSSSYSLSFSYFPPTPTPGSRHRSAGHEPGRSQRRGQPGGDHRHPGEGGDDGGQGQHHPGQPLRLQPALRHPGQVNLHSAPWPCRRYQLYLLRHRLLYTLLLQVAPTPCSCSCLCLFSYY